MTEARDIRTLVVKLLKAHHLRYMNFWKEPDPETGVSVTLLKFRRDKDHNPKAFFDALNESGFQYKKISKDPNALEIICEIWPRGQKGKMTKLREDSRSGVGTGAGQGAETPQNSGGTLHYLRIPNGEAQLDLVQAIAYELIEAGYVEDSEFLMRVGAEQDWNEFRRKVSAMFRRLRLYQRPEIRQIREQIAGEIISAMGPDSSLFEGLKGSDLEKKLNEIVHENIDLILDTRGISNSVIRRTASVSSETKIAKLRSLRRGVLNVCAMAEEAENSSALKQAQTYVKKIDMETDCLLNDVPNSSPLSYDGLFMKLVADKNYESAYLYLLMSDS